MAEPGFVYRVFDERHPRGDVFVVAEYLSRHIGIARIVVGPIEHPLAREMLLRYDHGDKPTFQELERAREIALRDYRLPQEAPKQLWTPRSRRRSHE